MVLLRLAATYPVYRLIEQGKLSRAQFEKKARAASSAIDKIVSTVNKDVKRSLSALDKEVRNAIIQAGDNDRLSRSDINGIIDRSVDNFVAARRQSMGRGSQDAIDAAQAFREKVAKIGDENARPSPINTKQARRIQKVHEEANEALGKSIRSKLKLEVAQGVDDGKTPNQVAKDMAAKRIASVRPVKTDPKQKAKRKKKGLPERQTSGALAQIEKQNRTELQQIFNAAAMSGAEGEGKSESLKTWVNKPPRVRASHKEAAKRYRVGGEEGPIKLNERFEVGEAELLYPSDPTAPQFIPEEVINCKCIVVEIQPGTQEEVRRR